MYYVVYQQNLIHAETAAQRDEVTGPSSHGQEEAGLGFKAMFIVTLPQQWVQLAENKSHVSTNEDQTIRSVCNKWG